MALRFIDSFDHYATADLEEKWDQELQSSTIVTDEKRTGAKSLRLFFIDSAVIKIFDAQPTWVVGFAIKLDGEPVGEIVLLEWGDTQFTTMSQITLKYTSTRKFEVWRGGSTAWLEEKLATTNETFLLNDGWHYFEFKCTINDTTGSFQLWIDEVEATWDGANTNRDTRASGTASTADRIQIEGLHGGNTWIDDLYILDGTGSQNNDKLGDVRVDAVMPDADGNYEEFTNSTGTDAFALVNEIPPNDDTDYVEHNVVGEKDSWSFQNIAATQDIHGVQLTHIARKTSANARSIKHLTRISGSDFLGPAITMGESYDGKEHIWELNPNTGSVWTTGQINGAEFGVEVA